VVARSSPDTRAALGARSGRKRAAADLLLPRETSIKARRSNAAKSTAVLERLARAIPRPHVELTFEDPWQLLVAVILSAQSTDRRVNLVTPELFRRWPTPAALGAAEPDEVETVIKSTGFFRNKTKAIRSASAMIAERWGGQVPRSVPELLEIPGIARKSANVVLGGGFGVTAGIATDTHAMRVARRLRLTLEAAPEKIEADLCKHFPRESWTKLGLRLVLYGRYVCTARAPDCKNCPLNEVCPSRLTKPEGSWQERADRQAAEMEPRAQGFVRP